MPPDPRYVPGGFSLDRTRTSVDLTALLPPGVPHRYFLSFVYPVFFSTGQTMHTHETHARTQPVTHVRAKQVISSTFSRNQQTLVPGLAAFGMVSRSILKDVSNTSPVVSYSSRCSLRVCLATGARNEINVPHDLLESVLDLVSSVCMCTASQSKNVRLEDDKTRAGHLSAATCALF